MASTVWRGFISFGLISIPVKLFRAARAERVSFRRLYRPKASGPEKPSDEDNQGEDDAEPAEQPMANRRSAAISIATPPTAPALEPLRQASIREGNDDPVDPASVVKGYEYEKDRYVVVEPDELKSIAPQTATSMQIEEFVKLAEVDPVYFETSYYVVPEDAGKKAYALLYRSLQTTGLVAVAQFAMHSREHVVILRPGKKGLLAHTMFFSSEVRSDQEFAADPNNMTPKELDLAQMLIHSLAAPFEPEKYRDTYREKLEAIIAAKVAGQPVSVAEKPPRSSAVVDITEALQKSLAALKKPAASEIQPRQDIKQTRAPRKSKSG